MAERILNMETHGRVSEIFGEYDFNLTLIEKYYGVEITHRDTVFKIKGEEENTEKAERALNSLMLLSEREETITEQNVRYVLSLVDDGEEDKLSALSKGVVSITSKGKPIKPKTMGQRVYIDAIKNNIVTFGIGPAGTGKTYLAVAMAVNALKNKEVDRLIITRPAVEAGESLGFLPGDLQNKVDPYLRPLYDALHEMLGPETYQKHMERGVIEVAPLAYMRGRTLDNSYIILDEAQNTTREQMKMFLTRIGFGSRAIITGDITQVDLPQGKKSGLKEVMRILKNIDGISFCMLTDRDVVRHPLVQQIVKAYERDETKNDRNPKRTEQA